MSNLSLILRFSDPVSALADFRRFKSEVYPVRLPFVSLVQQLPTLPRLCNASPLDLACHHVPLAVNSLDSSNEKARASHQGLLYLSSVELQVAAESRAHTHTPMPVFCCGTWIRPRWQLHTGAIQIPQ